MPATTFMGALKLKFVIWMLLFALPGGVVTTNAQPVTTNPTPASIDATRNDRPGWAPWTANSIQPCRGARNRRQPCARNRRITPWPSCQADPAGYQAGGFSGGEGSAGTQPERRLKPEERQVGRPL